MNSVVVGRTSDISDIGLTVPELSACNRARLRQAAGAAKAGARQALDLLHHLDGRTESEAELKQGKLVVGQSKAKARYRPHLGGNAF